MINTKEESSTEEEEDEEDEVYVSYIVKLFLNFRNWNRCSSSEHNLTKIFESLEFELYKIFKFYFRKSWKTTLGSNVNWKIV